MAFPLLGPTHGPDPDKPLQPFEDADCWFRLFVVPARLPARPIFDAIPSGGFFADLFAMLYEEVGGRLALRVDPRYKIMVVRRKPAYWIWGDWSEAGRMRKSSGVVAVELAPSEQAATHRCEEILRNWRAGTSYHDDPVLKARDVRRTIRASRLVPRTFSD